MNRINVEGATVDGAIGVVEHLSRDVVECEDFYGANLNLFLETAIDALYMVKRMPNDPFAFIDNGLKYEGKAIDLDGLNKSISSLEFISATFTLDSETKKSVDKLLAQLEDERFKKFGKLIDWSEVFRFINNIEKETNKNMYKGR